MTRNEILDANVIDDDSSLRPSSFDEYVGQTKLQLVQVLKKLVI